MSIFNSIKIPVSFFHRTRLELLDQFDYSNVMWKVQEELPGVTHEYLEEGIENLKKYYAVALLDPLNEHAVSEKVDPFWHAHILFTREYQAFCDSIFNQYIHHEPLNPKEEAEVKQVTGLYEYTLDIYDSIFNDLKRSWWPSVQSDSFKAICKHNELINPQIIANAIFNFEPRLYQQAA